jgi:3-oxoacyl-[acyl-carrier protein] reductase
MTRALASELAEQNITVNLVSPGMIGAPPATRSKPRFSTLTGAHGAPEDIAGMVRFLCGPQARYITGQTIHVNGGAYFGS